MPKIEFPKDILKLEQLNEKRKRQRAARRAERPAKETKQKEIKYFECICCKQQETTENESAIKQACKICFKAKCIVPTECKRKEYREAVFEFKYPTLGKIFEKDLAKYRKTTK
jgi:hypothetical protein